MLWIILKGKQTAGVKHPHRTEQIKRADRKRGKRKRDVKETERLSKSHRPLTQHGVAHEQHVCLLNQHLSLSLLHPPSRLWRSYFVIQFSDIQQPAPQQHAASPSPSLSKCLIFINLTAGVTFTSDRFGGPLTNALDSWLPNTGQTE